MSPEEAKNGDRRSQNLSVHCTGYIAVHHSENLAGNTIFVIVDERAAFDLIDLPQGETAKVLTKVIDFRPMQGAHGGPQYVVFQFWLVKP